MYKIEIIEEAVKMCDFILDEVKFKNHMVKKATGFIPGSKNKVTWNDAGLCFSKQGKRLPKFDLPIQTVLENIKLEKYNNVCRP